MGTDVRQAVRRASAARCRSPAARSTRAVPDPRPAQAAVPARRRRGAGHRPAPAQAGRRVDGDPGGRAAALAAAPSPDTPGVARPGRCGSTRSSSSWPPTWSTWSTRRPAATCSTGCGRCAARSRSSSASSCPPVRTRDNLDLPPSTYVDPAARRRGGPRRGARRAACSPSATTSATLPGTADPASRSSAWPPSGCRSSCASRPSWPAPPSSTASSVITTHLAEVVRSHAAALLGREDVRPLIDVVKRTHPVVVEELTPALLTLGEVQRVPAGAARRAGVDPRPRPDLRGPVAAGPGQRRPRRSGRGRPRRARPRHLRRPRRRRQAAGAHLRPAARADRCSSRCAPATPAASSCSTRCTPSGWPWRPPASPSRSSRPVTTRCSSAPSRCACRYAGWSSRPRPACPSCPTPSSAAS